MKYILLTGASGGMGLSTIKLLLDSGYKVIAIDKKRNDIVNPNYSFFECDITDIHNLEIVKEEIKKITDNLFAIIHFAGIYKLNSLIEINNDDFEKIFKVNVYGPFLVNKTMIDLLNKGSRIIITTSELALRDPLPFTGLYGITKHTLDKYAYSLKMELQLLDIDVAVLRPGAVKTDLLDISTKELDDFCNNTKYYNVSSTNFKNIVNNVEAKYILPNKISKKVLKILNKKHLRFAYNINHNKLLILLDILPKCWRFKIIKRILKKQ